MDFDEIESEQTPETTATPRTFAELHQDAWTLVFQHKLLFIMLPVLAWLPNSYLFESVARSPLGRNEGVLSVVTMPFDFVWIFVGALVAAVQLTFLKQESEGEGGASIGNAIRVGLFRWRAMIKTAWSVLWRVVLGFFFLIVPGIVLSIRYAVAFPVTIFEDSSGYESAKRSSNYVRGSAWRVFFICIGLLAIYLPFAVALGVMTPSGASPWLAAIMQSPLFALFSLEILVFMLIYVDSRAGWNPERPIGQVDTTQPWASALSRTNARFGVLVAAVLSVSSLVGAHFGNGYIVQSLVDRGDVAWYASDYEESRRLFERAVYWNAEDAYVQYSLAACYLELGNDDDAEASAAKAARAEPDILAYRLLWIQSMLALGVTKQAREEAQKLMDEGYDEFDDVESLLRELESYLDGKMERPKRRV